MANRSLGWVQNPSSFEKLQKVVAVFDHESYAYKYLLETAIPENVDDLDLRAKMLDELRKRPLSMSYDLLKGRGTSGQSRRDAKCSGIIQAILPNQSGRAYSDDWTTDGFIRWAISIGFLNYDRQSDEVSITELGLKFSRSTSPDTIKELLIQAFLSYPPAIRILELLKEQKHLTKFEIGRQLGGLGEPGFTSIPQYLYIQAISTATKENRSTIRSNTEGSADKYARMICTWLTGVGLVQRVPKEVSTSIGDTTYTETLGNAYLITLEGLSKLNYSKGMSSHSRIPKIVYWEMLATKIVDRDYVRTRRGLIIESIISRTRTLSEIQDYLFVNGQTEKISTILDEIEVIRAIGISVQESKGNYSISDDIENLIIPIEISVKSEVLEIKDRTREKLTLTNHRYLSLIDFAFDGGSNKEFEILTIQLFTEELDFCGVHLGDSRKPDGIISKNDNGVIIDNKAYQDGYSLPMSQADEMIRYLDENQKREKSLNKNEWWNYFQPNVSVFYFLFITSYLKGNFKSNLIHISRRTGTNGAAINAENLLYLSENLLNENFSYDEVFDLFLNDEILFD